MLDHLPQGPFALIRRGDEDSVELLQGPFEEFELLADLPTEDGDLLALVPYRQLRERGDACHDDGAPLLAMRSPPAGPVGRLRPPERRHAGPDATAPSTSTTTPTAWP